MTEGSFIILLLTCKILNPKVVFLFGCIQSGMLRHHLLPQAGEESDATTLSPPHYSVHSNNVRSISTVSGVSGNLHPRKDCEMYVCIQGERSTSRVGVLFWSTEDRLWEENESVRIHGAQAL